MAGIIKTSINLSNIPKDKIITGKKGKYLPITVTVNDEPDQFGNQGPVIVIGKYLPFLPVIILSFGMLLRLILVLIIPAILIVVNLVKHVL